MVCCSGGQEPSPGGGFSRGENLSGSGEGATRFKSRPRCGAATQPFLSVATIASAIATLSASLWLFAALPSCRPLSPSLWPPLSLSLSLPLTRSPPLPRSLALWLSRPLAHSRQPSPARFSQWFLGRIRQHIRCSIVVSISACHAEDLGSIPGGGVFRPGWTSPFCSNGASPPLALRHPPRRAPSSTTSGGEAALHQAGYGAVGRASDCRTFAAIRRPPARFRVAGPLSAPSHSATLHRRNDPGRARTCNPRPRRPMPYPLGHGANGQ